MSLLVWMPFNKDDKNYGLSDFSQKSGTIKLCDDGKIGKCADLTNYCSLFFPELADKRSFSISFWIYCKDGFTTNWNRALVVYDKKTDGKAGSGIRFESESDGICSITNNFEYAIISGVIRTTNVRDTWHHICVTCDGSVFTAYLNGEKIKYISANGGSLSGLIDIGNIYSSALYTGFMNDLRIYDEVISPKMIKILSQGLMCHIPMGNIDGMIGGRNLARNTNTNTSSWGWGLQTGNATKGYIEENDVVTCKLTRGDVASSGWSYIYYKNIGREKWKTTTNYVVSFDVKSNYQTTFKCKFMEMNGTNAMTDSVSCYYSKKNEWQRMIFKVTSYSSLPSSTSQVLYLSNANSSTGAYYQFKNLKIEEGTTATDWTPAPEDVPFLHDNIIYDTSGYRNNGSVTNTTCPTWSNDSPRYRGSYYFNGENTYVSLLNNPIQQSTKEFSIACWFKLTTVRGAQTFYTARIRAGEGVGLFFIGNKIRFDDNQQYTFQNYIFNSINTWTHICVTRSISAKNLYINGKLVDSCNQVGDMNNIGVKGTIGASQDSDNGIGSYSYLNGNLSDFRIYSTALSSQDILNLYQSSASLDSTGKLMLSGEVIE